MGRRSQGIIARLDQRGGKGWLGPLVSFLSFLAARFSFKVMAAGFLLSLVLFCSLPMIRAPDSPWQPVRQGAVAV